MLSPRLPVVLAATAAATIANAAEQNAAVAPVSLQTILEQAAVAPSAGTNVAAVTRNGFVDVNVSGAIKSTVPPAATRKLSCYIYFGAQSTTVVQSRIAYIPAVISGNNYTCKGKIYYKWTVLPTDKLIGSGSVTGFDTSDPVAVYGYYSGLSFTFTPTTSFPANGAVTKLTANGVDF